MIVAGKATQSGIGIISQASAQITARAMMKETLTKADIRRAWVRLRSGNRRQRAIAAENTPIPMVWDNAMALVPANCARRGPTFVPKARWATTS